MSIPVFRKALPLLVLLLMANANAVFAQGKGAAIDTTLQNDSFRTLEWVADSLTKSITERKPSAVLSLYPGAGVYIKYSEKVAPDITVPTALGRFSFYKLRLAKNHKKLLKQMRKNGLSFNKSTLDRIQIDTGTAERGIEYCRIRMHYKKDKKRFFIEANGIHILNQWFIVDGFLMEQKPDI